MGEAFPQPGAVRAQLEHAYMPGPFAAPEVRITPRGLVPFGLICHT